MRKTFSFLFPVTDCNTDRHRPGGFTYDHIADLEVSGVVTADIDGKHRSIQIEKVMHENNEVHGIQDSNDILESIRQACIHHLHLSKNRELEFHIAC